MPAQYYNISIDEFDSYITSLGFQEIKVAGAKETAYGKIIAPGLCLRILSGIVDGISRKRGKDAIRVSLVYKDKATGIIYPAGKQKRVHRVYGWKENLQKRIDNITTKKTETCVCGKPMVIRKNKKTKEEFFGCVGYPICKCTKPIPEEDDD